MITLRWADQCKYGHDVNRRTKEHDHVGQNVARQQNCDFKTDMESIDEMIQLWYDEVGNRYDILELSNTSLYFENLALTIQILIRAFIFEG